ncbi:MAG: hypothetical protein D6762_08800 [Candidatus Neomarinimicrobiota bacterium]|nr:MAG: hypothetical protein D6762_08800 [Candidatus Neomarinimicrobiota bacterium]
MKILGALGLLTLVLAVSACGQKKSTPGNEMKSSMEMSPGQMQHEMGGMEMEKMEGMHQTGYYTCPMESHKHVRSDQPGNCPECGMKLVKVVETTPEEADFWGCPMPEHSHIRADQPGKCPECGMKLKPMKMEKSAS